MPTASPPALGTSSRGSPEGWVTFLLPALSCLVAFAQAMPSTQTPTPFTQLDFFLAGSFKAKGGRRVLL